MSERLLELQNAVVLRHTDPTGLFGLWGAKPVRALDGVSLTLFRGETLGVMGSSGAGKSTLADVVTLRRPLERGRILFEGQDVARMKGSERRRLQRRLQIVKQDPWETLQMDVTVRKQFKEALRKHELSDADARIEQALAQVELPPSEFLDRTPTQMSGGQVQRVAIARALALNPVLIALDEPVSGVDPHLQLELIRLLQRVQRERALTYLLISQDPRTISRMAHRTAIFHAGRLFEIASTQDLLMESRHPYSRVFLGHEKTPLPPEEDRAGRVIAGCPWAEHCGLVSERCRKEMPELREIEPDRLAACHALEEGSAAGQAS